MNNDVVKINIEAKVKSKSSDVKTLNKQTKDKPSLFDKMVSKNNSSKKVKVSDKKDSTKSSNTNSVKSSLFDNLKKTSSKSIKTSKENNIIKDKNEDKKISLFDNLTKNNKLKNKKEELNKNIEKSIKSLSSSKESLNKIQIKDSNTKELNKKDSELNKKSIEIKSNEILNKEVLKVDVSLFDNVKQAIVSENLVNKNTLSNKKDSNLREIKDKKETIKPSLMDNLVKNAKNKKVLEVKIVDESNEITKDKLSAKTFLSNQQTKATIVSKHQIEESKKILLDDSIKDAKTKITKSAKTLELGETKVEVISEEKNKIEIKTVSKIDAKVQEQTTFLNKVLFKQALNTQDLQKIEQTKVIKQVSEVEQTTSEIKSEDIQVKEAANQTAIQHITNKIISARQNMKSFMSDMARKMYENYKPPVTSFKINLNPANLGSISIVMKSEKSTNSISISLNTSQSSTLEVLEGAKALLQNSLQKTFENQSNFSLDFSQNDSQSNSQSTDDNKKRKEDSNNKNKESQEIVENDISIDDGYM